MALTAKQRKEAMQRGVEAVELRPVDEEKFRRPSPSKVKSGFGVFAKPMSDEKQKTSESLSPVSFPDKNNKEQTLEPLSIGQTPEEQTLEGLSIGQTVCPSKLEISEKKKPQHRTEGLSYVEKGQTGNALAPLQWRTWQALLDLEEQTGIISYYKLTELTGGKLEGVKKAIRVLRRLGAIQSVAVVRSREGQGFQVVLDRNRVFHQVDLNTSKGIKRSKNIGQTTDPRLPVPTRMYVFNKNTYIQADDLAQLLRLTPAAWQIREQTLGQIADAFPTMTALEFRLSLRRLVAQAQSSKRPVQNPNAWLKAAFEKNGGPLVTEREIEARLEQKGPAPAPERSSSVPLPEVHDLATLRQYLAASVAQRAEIDELAAHRVQPLLHTLSPDKHPGIMEQARLEVAREYFARKA